MVAALDHDGFSTGNRWCRDGDRAERGNNVSKLLHVLLLISTRTKLRNPKKRSRETAREF
jgi:hypothetical protein